MRESDVYLGFLKRNSWFLAVPVIIGLGVAVGLYSLLPSQTKIVQSFKLEYELENIDQAVALTDQAVVELRNQRFASLYPDASLSIHKSGPLTVTIESLSGSKEVSYDLLLKESEYLRQNFTAREISAPEISYLEPSLLKYLLSAIILGGLIGLTLSLLKEYRANF